MTNGIVLRELRVVSDGANADRRGVLKVLAAGAAAFGASAAKAGPPASTGAGPANSQQSGLNTFDVVIIGGGMAGVTAAREMAQRGKTCVILEGRNRLGGRTFSTEVFGRRGDVGGQWMHWIQPHVWAEITRYGLPIVETPGGNPEAVGVIIDNRLRMFTPDETLPLLTQGANALFPETETVFPRPYDPWFNPDFVKLDRYSVADRMRTTTLSPVQRSMLEAYYTTAISGSIETGGLLDQIHWLARANGDSGLLLRACMEFKLRDGTTSMLQHIAADANADIRLNSTVASVEQVGNRVVARTEDGQSVSGAVCIVALPMNCWNDIEWKPGLLPGKRKASELRHAGSGFELHIKVAGRQKAYLGFAPAASALNLLYTDDVTDDGTVMVGMGCSANGLDINDDAQVTRALHSLMPDAKMVESYAYDWNADPFSKGTWCNYRPGMWSQYGKDMRQPENRLVFAGSDVANGWRGFIDGAIETGFRASREALAIITKE